jgi:hypothetical protein
MASDEPIRGRVVTPAPALKESGPSPRAALEDLAALLDPRVHATVLITGDGRPPRLAVAHRRLPLIEDVYAGASWYWWGWAERIGLVTNPVAAAYAVTRRLRAFPEPAHG